jgi:hypothetical protein
MGPEDGAARDFDQLSGDADLVAGRKKGAGEDDVDFGFVGNFLEIGNILRILRGNERGANDEIVEAGKRDGDGFREAVGKEFQIFAAAEQAKGRTIMRRRVCARATVSMPSASSALRRSSAIFSADG